MAWRDGWNDRRYEVWLLTAEGERLRSGPQVRSGSLAATVWLLRSAGAPSFGQVRRDGYAGAVWTLG